MEEEKQWYTSQEAAEYLKIPMHRLARLRRQGRIHGVIGGGDNPRYAMYHISELKKVDNTDLRTLRGKAPIPEQKEEEPRGSDKKVA